MPLCRILNSPYRRCSFRQARFDVADNGGGIGASDYILPAAREPYQEAMASAAVIAEVRPDHYVAEIAPIAERPPLPQSLSPPAEG